MRSDTLLSVPPLGLYIHFPWCVKKCPYCDFNSHTRSASIDQQGYIDVLIRDLEYDLQRYGDNRELTSIFMGGGTPSLFSAQSIARLLVAIEARLTFAKGIEITLEANPGAVEHDDFAGYLNAGCNRLSLGVQSFNDAQLKNLGRIHTASNAETAIQAALDSGFVNINIDLMYGLPQQSPESAQCDLLAALTFLPNHLSLYQLTIEANTLFHRYPPKLPDHDQIIEIEQSLYELMVQHNYQRYEVSAYAKPGMQCRHNLNYWQFGDYLGIGAGAHGKITHMNAIERYSKQKHPRQYIASAGSEHGIGNRWKVTDRARLFEFLLGGLRLTDGFDKRLVPERTNCDIDELLPLLQKAAERKWIIFDNGRVRCSASGYRFLDDILQDMLP